MERARRFPNPHVQPSARFGTGTPDALTLVDRVDALSALFRDAAPPRAAILVKDASQALGTVLRDFSVLRQMLDKLEPRDGFARRVLCVALGLLGHLPRLDVAVPDPSDPMDTAAWALTAICADPGGAPRSLRRLEDRAEAGARQALYQIVWRVDTGDVLNAVA